MTRGEERMAAPLSPRERILEPLRKNIASLGGQGGWRRVLVLMISEKKRKEEDFGLMKR